MIDHILEKGYQVANWLMRLAYINLLWFLFTLIGLVVIGVFPATVSAYTVIRKCMIENKDVPIFTTFWQAYKNYLLKANIICYMFLLIGFILAVDISFFFKGNHLLWTVLGVISIIVFVFYIGMCLMLFPVIVHYDLPYLQYIKQTFLVVVLSPVTTIVICLTLLMSFILLYYIPAAFPFYGVSLIVYVSMYLSLKAFNRLQIQKTNGL